MGLPRWAAQHWPETSLPGSTEQPQHGKGLVGVLPIVLVPVPPQLWAEGRGVSEGRSGSVQPNTVQGH